MKTSIIKPIMGLVLYGATALTTANALDCTLTLFNAQGSPILVTTNEHIIAAHKLILGVLPPGAEPFATIVGADCGQIVPPNQ